MNVTPASAGPYNQTFSPGPGEEVFLCLESGMRLPASWEPHHPDHDHSYK